MHIDKNLVQKLISDTIGLQYTIHDSYETSKYIFIDWKHKDYEADDERGHRIGVGPVAFNKITKEYKLLGSGDMIHGDYMEYINDDADEKIPTLTEIKTSILRRNYVNLDDLRNLQVNMSKTIGEQKYHISHNGELDLTEHFILNSKSKIFIQYIIDFWIEIGFQYKSISESDLLVWRVKKTSVS